MCVCVRVCARVGMCVRATFIFNLSLQVTAIKSNCVTSHTLHTLHPLCHVTSLLPITISLCSSHVTLPHVTLYTHFHTPFTPCYTSPSHSFNTPSVTLLRHCLIIPDTGCTVLSHPLATLSCHTHITVFPPHYTPCHIHSSDTLPLISRSHPTTTTTTTITHPRHILVTVPFLPNIIISPYPQEELRPLVNIP